MAKKLADHTQGIVDYLSDPSEKANEDLILKYFRKVWGSRFTRQKEAKNSDGYVAGSFVLELKGKKSDWLAGFFQGIAYSKELNFSQVIVATRNFLSVWRLDDLDQKWINDVLEMKCAPNSIGKKLATKYKSNSRKIQNSAIWSLSLDFEGDLLKPTFGSIDKEFKNFEKAIKTGEKTRKKITIQNFHTILKEMKVYFDPDMPIRTVRAFYNMIFSWDLNSILDLSQRNKTQATMNGEIIESLIPGKRLQFKLFVEDHYVLLGEDEDIDDFFSLYDKALDSVDKDFRVKNGIFFTDLNLSKLVMAFVKDQLGDIGKNHLVIDPACGSGNLVTNWKSPLELRHKVVSEIEPELLYTVEKRMKGDKWHNGKFTVVPKVEESKGLNFLDKSAEEYLDILTGYLSEKGHKPDKPIAFLCNPPYRSDDDQSADSIKYDVHDSIVELTGKDGAAERYSCFLAQMLNICKQAEGSGFPENSLMILFTKSAWLTKRPVFSEIRRNILGHFEDVGGFLVNGKEYFEVKGKFPIAITVWRYKGEGTGLDSERTIKLKDLTRLTKKNLADVNWNDPEEYLSYCTETLNHSSSIDVVLGDERQRFSGKWLGVGRKNLYRNLIKSEKEDKTNSHMGLPNGDERHNKKTIYGYSEGSQIGFLLDLTPCRTKVSDEYKGKPWFHLDSRFMRVNTNRMFSGLPDSRGYCAVDYQSAVKMFTWYSISRTFALQGFPMWADAEEMWPIEIDNNRDRFLRYVFSIGFAENDCVETYFPANNPVSGIPEANVSNPMTSNDKNSFWSKEILTNLKLINDKPSELIRKVTALYTLWKKEVGKGNEIYVPYDKAYFVGEGVLGTGAGIAQIKDYIKEVGSDKLEKSWNEVNELLKEVKQSFHKDLISGEIFNYFGASKKQKVIENKKEKVEESNVLYFKPRTQFDKVLEKRLALMSKIIQSLPNDAKLNRVKIAKAVYLCDMLTSEDLKTKYVREAAGPLDQRFFYNEKIGVDSLGTKLGLFSIEHKKLKNGEQYRYKSGKNIDSMASRASDIFGKDNVNMERVLSLMSEMNYEQSEIFATIYACWNDLLLSKKKATQKAIVEEFLNKWHPEKKQYEEKRIISAINWMKEKKIVPKGTPPKVDPKAFNESIPF